jgi:hypothetical protein
MLAVATVAGCGFTRSSYETLFQGKAGLKRKALVFPFYDQSGAGPAFVSKATDALRTALEASRCVVVHAPPEGLSLPQNVRSPEFGIVTPPELIHAAESLGMQALVTGVLNPAEVSTRMGGFWPLREQKRVFEMALVINVVDTASGALLATHLERGEVIRPADESPPAGEGEGVSEAWEEAFPKILKRAVSAVTASLKNAPWSSRIETVENHLVRIDGGRDIGIAEGDIFQVFSRGEGIPSKIGPVFYAVGEKRGELKVTQVLPGHAFATPVAGGPFEKGQFIYFKP